MFNISFYAQCTLTLREFHKGQLSPVLFMLTGIMKIVTFSGMIPWVPVVIY
jgi:hypothetical protein